MATEGSERDPLERLAQEFVVRHRHGERPSVTEYTQKYPELADQIRDLFPALVLMENLGSVAGQATGPDAGTVAEGGVPRQLGEYRILRMVGRGGMGVVFEAVQESLGRHVALKVLPLHGLLNPTHLERFRREARAAAGLHHTNIVPVFGVGEHEGAHYYAMQFIQGQSLDVVLKELKRLREQKQSAPADSHRAAADLTVSVANGLRTGRFEKQTPDVVRSLRDRSLPLPVSEKPDHTGEPGRLELVSQSEGQYFRSVAQMGVQVADALTHAHQNNILHRDIKPSNLLLDRWGTVWVTDFGLAKSEGSDELTHPGDIVGTLRYMAPERFRGQSEPRSDIYGLGVTLYELLTLTPAFSDTDRARLIERVTHGDPPRPRKLDPHIPRDLETIVLKASAREPGDRYATADDLAQDLRRFLSDKPIQARRAGLPERAWRWCRRNPAVASLTLALGALLLTVAVGSLVEVFRIAADRDALASARDEADHNAGLAEQARQKEEQERKRAEEVAAESRQRLARLCVANGMRLLDDGDGLGALTWFAEALKRDADDPARADTHRVRLASALRQSPRLLQLWSCDLPVYHVEFSPDGRYVVAASGQLHFVSPARGEARVWDAATGKLVFPVLKHALPVYHASFSRDGRRLVTGSGGNVPIGPRMMKGAGEARVWDAATGRPLTRALEHETWVRQATFSPDGGQLLTLSGAYNAFEGARVWDVGRGEPVGQPVKHDRGHSFSLSADGRQLAIGSWMDARVYDVFTGQPLTPLLKHGLKEVGKGARRGVVNCVAFSPDGRRVVTASGDDTARVWDAVTGAAITPPLKHNDKVNHATFSPDGRQVLTASDDETARVWDATTGDPVTRLIKHGGPVVYAAFSPDGLRILTVSGDPPVRSSDTTGYQLVRVWNAATGSPAGPVFKHGGRVSRAAFSPEGRRLVTAGMDGVVRLWDLGLEDPAAFSFPSGGWVSHVAFSPGGGRIFTRSGDGTGRVWDVVKHKAVPLTGKLSGYVNYLAFSPDGRRVLTANGSSPFGPFKHDEARDKFTDDRQAQVWDCATGKPVGAPLRHEQHVSHASFSPDGRQVVTASEDKTARVWQVETGKPITQALQHGDRVTGASFSPDGRLVVTTSWDGTARVWNAATGEPAGPVLKPIRSVNRASFSPDGRQILTDGYERTARLWDPATGQVLGAPLRHGGHMTEAFFGGDRCRILVVLDQEARVWDVSRGEPVTPLLKHGAQVNFAGFSRDGRRVVTASEDGTARVWDAVTGEPVTPPLHHGSVRQNLSFSPTGRSDVPRAAFSTDGRRLVVVGPAAVQTWDLRPDERPAEDLVQLTVLLSGHQIDSSGGCVPVSKDTLTKTWESLRARYPGQFAGARPEALSWHPLHGEQGEIGH